VWFRVLWQKCLSFNLQLSKKQLLLFGLAAHILAAFFSIGAHQCDEIFQVYEFAGYKLGLNTASELPWEFHEQMRSGIQPFIVYCITKALHVISIENPFTITWIIRTLQTLFSFFVMLRLLNLLERELPSQKYKGWLYGFGSLFCYLSYFHARFSSENFSATLFILGLVIFLNAMYKKPSFLHLVTAGILFGLAFEARFQISFMIFGFFLWLLLIRKLQARYLIIAAFGLVLSLGIGLLADHWLYDRWTLSWWNYLDLNLFKDKASVYGREPFYFYIGEALLQLIPPFSAIILIFVVGFWIRFKTHVITWITVPFIFLHFFVAHKELRFLFPMLNFLPFMVVYYFQSVENYPNRFVAFLKTKFFIRFAVMVNLLILIYYVFKPADNTAPMLKKIYELGKAEKTILLYEGSNPYSDMASLHYFRNKHVTTVDLKQDSLSFKSTQWVYYFSNNFYSPELIIKNNSVFKRTYSNFPAWFGYLNFNGWLERSDPFSLYVKL